MLTWPCPDTPTQLHVQADTPAHQHARWGTRCTHPLPTAVPQCHPARATRCDMHTALITRVLQPGWMQMLPGMRLGAQGHAWAPTASLGTRICTKEHPRPAQRWARPLGPTLSRRNAGSALSSVPALYPQTWPRAEAKALMAWEG